MCIYMLSGRKQKKHTLTYVSNYPNRKEGEPHEERIDSETPCTEQTVIRIDGSSFQCDGHRFLGWSLTPDGSSELITPEVQYTNSTVTVLYAIWTDDCEEYTLMYSSNTEGASLGSGSGFSIAGRYTSDDHSKSVFK